MKLYEGKNEEYKKRHDALWQEMKDNRSGHDRFCRILSGVCPVERSRGVHITARRNCENTVRVLAAGPAGVNRTDIFAAYEQISSD